MFQYRHVLVRMRQGDSDRDIKRAKLMGRRKAAELREVAEERGWLQPESELPDDATIAGALGESRRAASTISSSRLPIVGSSGTTTASSFDRASARMTKSGTLPSINPTQAPVPIPIACSSCARRSTR